jgi:hypothetical protein
MKKFWILIFVVTTIFVITACGDGQEAFVPESPGSSAQNGENSSGNGSDSTTPGNGDNNGNNGDSNGNGSDSHTNGDPQPAPVFSFTYRDVVINLGDDIDLVISKLGEPMGESRVASCAFEGLDERIVGYPEVQFQALQSGESFNIFYIGFDDRVPNARTSEGRIYIGSSVQAVLDAYGDDYDYDTGAYKYTRGLTSLMFITNGEFVEGIQYRLDLGL